MLVTPLVAFDEDGSAWGWAVDFMTVFRCKTGSSIRSSPWATQYDCQLVEKLPVEEWDIPLPAVVTPSKIWEW
ncbi:hypothetical protein KCP76_05175 [Salmonella enterica subsp. enterica serovar Weltevreden]|nr:hypothetical protein KCP76_05175 [Salmonella enterica subsp. enterica serovar Weltevreden]